MYTCYFFKGLSKQPERISVPHIRLCGVRYILNVRKLLDLVLVHPCLGQPFVVKGHIVHAVFYKVFKLFELDLLDLRP